MSEPEITEDTTWELQRNWREGRWFQAGFNVYGRKQGCQLLKKVRQNQPHLLFRLVEIHTSKRVKEICVTNREARER